MQYTDANCDDGRSRLGDWMWITSCGIAYLTIAVGQYVSTGSMGVSHVQYVDVQALIPSVQVG